MAIVIVERWSIRPEKMVRIQEFLEDLPKWKEFDESFGGKLLGVFNTLIGDGPFSNYMAVFTMPDMATWERVLTEEAPKRMAEELKRWNEMTTNYSITVMQQVL